MAWVYILRGTSRHYIGDTGDLQRRITEHERGSNHTTHRLGNRIELIVAKEVPSMADARKLELVLKRKKNPQLAISMLQSLSYEAAPKAFGVGSGFESRPIQL
jgi:predicted GIY-YIG superfamily endonuclease